MRYLVYLLIIANLAFFAWYPRPLVPQDPYPVHYAPVPRDTLTLVKLDERRLAEEYFRSQERVEEEVATGSGATEGAESIAAAEPVADPVAAPAPIPQEVVAPAPSVPVAICHTVGPFTSRADADRATAQLQGWGASVERRTSDVQEQVGYWVYLPAMPAQQARETETQLKAQGVTDYFVGKQNYISLGLFSDKAIAERRRVDIEKLGYEPKLEPRFKTRTGYWLDVQEMSDQALEAARWQELADTFADARHQTLACE